MNYSVKTILTVAIFLTVISFAVKAQTNVSGGIYTNTIWTLANSPYIIVDTVVVFPGVTLSIEPGVTVKFTDNKSIEIRQAKLIADGTINDSITFTSNSFSPTPGIFSGIYLNGGNLTSLFNYCNFSYAKIGINATISDSIIVMDSYFNQNLTGMQFIGNTVAQVASISNSIFDNNSNQGLILKGLYSSKVNYCNFSNNGTQGLIIDDLQGQMASTMNNCDFTFNGTGMLCSMHHLLMNCCNFSNNGNGMEGFEYLSPYDIYTNATRNCIFNFNQTGIANIGRMLFENCTINHNQTGCVSGGVNRIKNCTIDSNNVLGISTYNDSVTNCNILYNVEGIRTGSVSVIIGNSIENNTGANISCGFGKTTINGNTISYGTIGIDNTISGTLIITKNTIENNYLGINLTSSNSTIICNRICNNTEYDLRYGAGSNIDAIHNYWCTPDSTSTEAVIYDGYDNINFGLVNFMPLDTVECYLTNGIPNNKTLALLFNIFPNPATSYVTVELPENGAKTEIKIFNLLGGLEYSSTVMQQWSSIDVSSLASGIYIIQIETGNTVSRKKFIRQ